MHRTTVTTKRRRGMQRWWNRAFALLLCVSLASGVASVALVAGLVGRYDGTAREVDRETALLGSLVLALQREQTLAHNLIDFGAGFAPRYAVADRASSVLLDRGRGTFDARPGRLVEQARRQWLDMYAFLRPVAADADAADHLEARLGDDDLAHAVLAADQSKLDATLAAIDADVHREAHKGLAEARHVERQVVAVFIAMSALAFATVLILARRLRRRVLLPVRELAEAALDFGAGRLDRRPVIDQDDELGDLAASFSAMADSVAAQHVHLTKEAYRDPLTGLPNRRAFVEGLEGALTLPEPCGVMFIDLDDFKLVNDSLGHAAGDQLLTLVAGRLAQAIRDSDVVARLGGDEFAVLLNRPAGRDTALAVAERIRVAFTDLFVLDPGAVRVGVSIGVALRDDARRDTEELMRGADSAMYAAKGLGKNRVELFDPTLHGERPVERVTPAG